MQLSFVLAPTRLEDSSNRNYAWKAVLPSTILGSDETLSS